MSPSDDRARILGALRRAAPAAADRAHPGTHPVPPLQGGWTAFATRLASVGGRAHGPHPRAGLAAEVAALARRHSARGRIVADHGAGDLLGVGAWEGLPDDAAPHACRDVAVAIVHGEVGVAENAAVAVLGGSAALRALPFLCEHLILLLDEERVVPDLHSAFAELPPSALASSHCVWISGPSKTADIEQTLVYGAHGPLSCDVVGFTHGSSAAEIPLQ